MTATLEYKPERLKEPRYSITKSDFQMTEKAFGACNCGPTALAIMLSMPALEVTRHIPGYKEKHYVNPTMMQSALTSLGVKFHPRFRRGYERVANEDPHLLCEYGLCRIQWCGPWTDPGANAKWAYRQTHWVASMNVLRPIQREGYNTVVFDVNSGWTSQLHWEAHTVPSLVKMYPRANGEWFVTHRIELEL